MIKGAKANQLSFVRCMISDSRGTSSFLIAFFICPKSKSVTSFRNPRTDIAICHTFLPVTQVTWVTDHLQHTDGCRVFLLVTHNNWPFFKNSPNEISSPGSILAMVLCSARFGQFRRNTCNTSYQHSGFRLRQGHRF